MDEMPDKVPPIYDAEASAQRSPWGLLLVGLCLFLVLLSAGVAVAGVSLVMYWRAVERAVAENPPRQNIQLVPLSATRPLTPSAQQVVIDIDAAGTFSIEGCEVSAAELEASLQQVRNENAGNVAVTIRADTKSPFHLYVEVVNVCSKVGITNASLVTAGEP